MSTDPRIEAAAKSVHPHLWDGRTEQVLLQLTGAAACTPAQAKESVERLQGQRLEEVQAYIAAADQAATIATWERLDALPVGSRILLAGVHLERDPEPVDDGVWRDLSNALHLDDVDMRFLLERHAAHVTRWGKA